MKMGKTMFTSNRIWIPFLYIFHSTLSSPSTEDKCPQFKANSRVSPYGRIISPKWPQPYPPDAHCVYRLEGEPWQGVRITFLAFDLEPAYKAGCINDYLEVNTRDSQGEKTFYNRYCGSETPPPIFVLSPVVELSFRASKAIHHVGFAASFEFIDEANVGAPKLNGTSPCGDLVQGKGGYITSPGYPLGYSAGLDCPWLIRVQYGHVVYLRIQHFEFQGNTNNCQKAQLRIYDGYETSLKEESVLTKFCGDIRYYNKPDGENYVLSASNRLLVRFTTSEASTLNASTDTTSRVGFQLIWSDVEYMSPENCTKSGRFACEETQVCRHKQMPNCPEHYCISPSLLCDGRPNCAEYDASDEKYCSGKAPLVLTVVAGPLAILTSCLFCCYLVYKRNNRKNKRLARRNSLDRKPPSHSTSRGEMRNSKSSSSSCCCWLKPSNPKNHELGIKEEKFRPGAFCSEEVNTNSISRGPVYFKHELESPGASDIVSPASGFSDSESDMGMGLGNSSAPIYCPAHGPVHFLPLRYLTRHYPLLPVVQETAGNFADFYDEGGSIYSTSQNSDMVIYEDKGIIHPPLQHNNMDDESKAGSNNESNNLNNSFGSSMQMQQHALGGFEPFAEWRMKQLRRIQRSDAIYISDDNKSSINSSPGRICPRCLEKERSTTQLSDTSNNTTTKINSLLPSCRLLEKQNSSVQFDSGIDVMMDNIITTEPTKNVSFETCTSSDSAISQGMGHAFQHYRPRLFGGWKDKLCSLPPPPSPPTAEEATTQTDNDNLHSCVNDGERNRRCNGEDNVSSETVTTFGVNHPTVSSGSSNVQTQTTSARATDV